MIIHIFLFISPGSTFKTAYFVHHFCTKIRIPTCIRILFQSAQNLINVYSRAPTFNGHQLWKSTRPDEKTRGQPWIKRQKPHKSKKCIRPTGKPLIHVERADWPESDKNPIHPLSAKTGNSTTCKIEQLSQKLSYYFTITPEFRWSADSWYWKPLGKNPPRAKFRKITILSISRIEYSFSLQRILPQ